MKQRITWILVAVAAVAGLWWLLAGRGEPESAKTDDEARTETGIDRRAIVERKRKAREGGEIDLSPATARGRITAEGGGGLEGAIVLLTPKGLDQQTRGGSPGEPARPLQARTRADGTWSIAPVPAGRYSLSATAVGYLPATRADITLVAGQDNDGLDLVLGRGGHEVRGTVSDIGGGPVEDVLVRVTRIDGSPFNFDRPALGVVTDDEGAFVLQLADGHYSVGTFHPDYVDASQTLRVDGGPRSLTFTITPAASIEGRVLARATGEPVEGAIVSRSGEDTGGFVVQGLGQDQVITDAEGRFRLRGMPSGVVRLHAVARGYSTRQPVEVVLGVAEQVSDVEILVDEALTISGFVVAQGDEERGLEGVLVGAFSLDPGRLYVASAPSAADGYFEIFGVLPGGYTVGAIGEDSLPNILGASAAVTDEDVTDVLVVMNAGVHLRGRVSPGVPATISVRVDGESMSMGTIMQTMSNALVRGRSGDDGVFDLHPVAEGALTVVAEAEDGSRGELKVEVGEVDLDGLVIELQPRASVAGRVVDANGGPGAGLEVAFRSTTPAAGATMTLSFDVQSGRRSATTDEDGNFEVDGLDAGDYEVSVSAARGPTLEWAEPVDPEQPRAPIEMTVNEGERRSGVVLAVEARDGVISGVVVGPDGEPAVDAWVTAVRNDSAREWMAEMTRGRSGGGDDEPDEAEAEKRERNLEQWEMMGLAEPPVLTGEGGRFEVTGLRSGTYRLRAEAHKDGARGYVDQAQPGTDVRIALEPLAGLEGVVRFRGKPVREYTVSVAGRSSRQQQVHAADGRFFMSRLDVGDYEVVARCSEGVAKAQVEIAGRGTTSVTLDVGGWGTLRGIVVDAGTGDPIPGLSITVMGDGGPSASSVMGMFTGAGPKTDAEGRFSVGEVPPGEGKVLFFDRDATGMGGAVAQADYEVEADGEQDLGTITGVAPSYIPPDERGTLGLQVKAATYDQRPRAPGAEDGEEPAAPDQPRRLWVLQVTPGGAAAQAGLVPGDEILSVDGASVSTMGATNAAKLLSPQYVRVGDDVALEIDHDGSRNTVTMIAGPPAAPGG
ncbi:carboxypeptidase regulatory-like domain-containing protein [Paraliomyxa miuraensis]|uniref:carboxypeptidase regulatory-like domain-containing protein n=1 Tax=Paraliomyxa miuraensis TaxID=376150 RepID=UPI00225A1FD9|nr:carboxypeptidase regulatory-like domain-containing protein [Paraliomyxa miuraensis]MCX4245613.1 carboxypeptidase regulatory-like domain-containing protein [Paraliomyxa miuraensis]